MVNLNIDMVNYSDESNDEFDEEDVPSPKEVPEFSDNHISTLRDPNLSYSL